MLGVEDMYGYYGFSLSDGSDAGPDMFLHTHVVQHSAVHSENAHRLNTEAVYSEWCIKTYYMQGCKVMHVSGTAAVASCMKR